MIAAITDLRSQFVGIHRTYLRADGLGKAALQAPKKMLGIWGHVILMPPMGGRLAIAEGIETALSIAKARPDIGVYSAMSLNNMGAPVSRAVRELILCADGDNKDPVAAERVLQGSVRKHQAALEHCMVRVARPQVGMDFNDMIKQAKQDEVKRLLEQS